MGQDSTPVIHRHISVTDAAGKSLSQQCSRVGEVMSGIGDKWTVLIVMLLVRGPRRFSELKREIGGISQRMLTLTLRRLERDGLVTRTVYATVPPRVDYELTALGHSLRQATEALGRWAVDHLGVIEAARREFDARAEGAAMAPPLPLPHIVASRR